MTFNVTKLLVVAVLAIVLIVAIVVDSDAADWAAPLLGLLVGYAVGNTSATDIAPIVSRDD
jgi:hypothetical protein